jgi:hypothetical protein
VSAVDFFVRTHGRDALIQLIRSYADGRTDDEAFTAAIGVDVGAFNDAWMADLGAVAPKRYGPQPAPVGEPGSIRPSTETGSGTRTWVLVAILGGIVVASMLLFVRERGRRTSRHSIVPGP